MERFFRRKLNNSGGTNLVVVIALLIVIALAVVLLIPSIRSWLNHGSTDGCDLSLRKIRDVLRIEFGTETHTDLDRAREVVAKQGAYCPGGGEFYVIEDSSSPGGVNVVCGIHDSNTLRRTTLNAENAYDQLTAALADAARRNEPAPDTVAITLNGATLTAQRRASEPTITRGTYLTNGVEGTVLYYVLNADGELTYFCYADPDHCARWRPVSGWIKEGAA